MESPPLSRAGLPRGSHPHYIAGMSSDPAASAAPTPDEVRDVPLRTFAAPAGLAFFAGAAIMIVEIVASRLAAQYLGASLYTWTSAIGSVLIGLTLGNYVGGRLADVGRPRRMLAGVLACASMACLALPSWNLTLRDWEVLWAMGIPARTAVHMMAAFVIPTALLAMIGPLVARVALDQGRGRGRAIGGINAWNAAGCITGTFLAGFVLVAWMGSARSLCLVSVAAALCALLLARDWGVAHLVFYVAAGAMVLSVLPAPFAVTLSEVVGLRPLRGPDVIEIDESEYSYISVERDPRQKGVHVLRMDQLVHSQSKPDDPLFLGYDYERIYTAITQRIRPAGGAIRGMVIGGGGYTYPRYFITRWPESRMEVAEIDPAVTQAAVKHFGLNATDPRLTVHDADGRNVLRNLLRRKRAGESVPAYDFIYGDAVNDYSVPHHLTTVEYDRMVADLLAPDGAYLINLIDSFQSGRFLGPIVQTLRQVFPDVHVFCTLPSVLMRPGGRDTFVVVASKQPLDIAGLMLDDGPGRTRPLEAIPGKLIDELVARCGGLTLTDDYAPVQYLLASVVRESLRDVRAFTDRGSQFLNEGDPQSAERYFRRAMALNPTEPDPQIRLAVALLRQDRTAEATALLLKLTSAEPGNAEAWNVLGLAHRHAGRMAEAVAAYRTGLRILPDAANFHVNLADTLAGDNQFGPALPHYLSAIRLAGDNPLAWLGAGRCFAKLGKPDDAEQSLARANQLDPQLAAVYVEQAGVRLAQARAGEAVELLKQALRLEPRAAGTHYEMARALRMAGRLDAAVNAYRESLRLDPRQPEAHYNLGNLFMELRSARDAEREFLAALQQKHDYVEAVINLGLLYEATGRTPDAVRVLEEGMKQCKDDATIGLRLAWILATDNDASQRNGPRAKQMAQRAVDAAGDKVPASSLLVLAAAQAQAGDFDAALATIARAKPTAPAGLLGELHRCEALFKQNQVYERPAAPASASAPASAGR